MKILNLRSMPFKSVLGICLFAFALQSCEDHRMAPVVQDLPDQQFYGLTDGNVIYELNVKNTASPIRTIPVGEGLVDGDKLIGIDFRPATGQLYGVGQSSRLYHINLNSAVKPGLATPIGTGFGGPITATSVGFDFNPTVDRIRFVTNTGQNLRLHPETGAIAATDGSLNGVPSLTVGAVAYTNSFAGTTATALFDIDATADKLYLQSNPNAGTLQEVGALGLDIADVGGFDIAPFKTAGGKDYAIASVLFGGAWELDYVDLASGRLQKLGNLPTGKIIGIAIPSPVAYAISSNKLLIFNPMSPTISVIEKPVTNLPAGMFLVGIDFRPLDAMLYALGSDSKIYTINALTGAATLKSSLDVPISSGLDSAYGVDFNPFADRLRVVSSTGQNLRINVETGVTVVDTPLTFAGASKGVNGAAYTNSHTGLTAGGQTMLFDVDSQTNKLYKQDPNPNAGVLVEVGNLGIVVEKSNGFDIGGLTKTGYGIFTVSGAAGLYKVNLDSGAATKVSDFPSSVNGFALGFNL